MKNFYRSPVNSGQTVSRSRHRRKVQRRSAKSFAKGLLLLLLGLSSFFLTALVKEEAPRLIGTLPLFPLERIEVRGAAGLSADEAVEAVGVERGAGLLSFDLEELRRRLLRHAAVKSASVSRLLPGTLVIEVEERIPAAVVRCGGDYLVDDEGVVIGDLEGRSVPSLPLVEGPCVEAGRVRAEDRGDLAQGLELAAAMRAVRFPPWEEVARFDLRDGSDAVLVPAGAGPAVHVGRRGVEERLRRYRAVAEDLASRWPALEYVDLRADGLVVAKPALPPEEPPPGPGGDG